MCINTLAATSGERNVLGMVGGRMGVTFFFSGSVFLALRVSGGMTGGGIGVIFLNFIGLGVLLLPRLQWLT